MAQIRETYKTMQMKLHAEIRKVEEHTNSFTDKSGSIRESKAIILKVDDDDEERIELVDKCSDNLANYKKGMVGTFTLRLDLEKKFGVGNYEAKMFIIKFVED